jgi:hypothetical protein
MGGKQKSVTMLGLIWRAASCSRPEVEKSPHKLAHCFNDSRLTNSIAGNGKRHRHVTCQGEVVLTSPRELRISGSRNPSILKCGASGDLTGRVHRR